MKISKNSWHFKMHKIFNAGMEPKYKSLCTYFWGTVFTALLFYVLLPLLGLGVLVLSTFPFVYFFTGDLSALAPAIIIGGFEIFALVTFWLDYRSKHYTRKIKEPTLVGEYIKAKKRKICPLIEFVDE